MVRRDSPVLRATVRSSWSWVMGVSFLGSTVDVAPPGLLSLAAPNWVEMRIPGIGDAGAPDACSACGGRGAVALVTAWRWPGRKPGDEIDRGGSGRSHEPVSLQPATLGLQGLTAATEGTEHRAADGLEVRVPAALLVRLDEAGAPDLHGAEDRQVDLFRVDRSGSP